ncbi:unnamed protein product, partial [Nesidiocoris tenuis]
MADLNPRSVECPYCERTFTRQGLTRHIRSAHQSRQQPESGRNSYDTQNQAPISIQNYFIQAFGAPMLNSIGQEGSTWHNRWKKAMTLQGRQYDLPQGAVGRRFVTLLTEEIQGVVTGMHMSEKIFVFCATVLQREKHVNSGNDVRRVLTKRMDLWRESKFDEVLQEAIRCERQLKKYQKSYEDIDHSARVFTRLITKGKLRDGTRLITNRSGGGVLQPNDRLDDGRTVLEILESKHPEQLQPDPSLFLQDENLPVLVDVNISETHISKAAHRLKGSAGPSGTDGDQWRNMLLRYGNHSLRLREAVASLTRFLANSVVEWDQIKAILARRGVALDKCPGVRPIGVGEVLQRICAKTMAMVTGEDLREESGSDQLCAGTKI